MPRKISDPYQYLIEKSEVDHSSGCILFTRCPCTNGTGRIKMRGKTYRANRVAYALANEIDPSDIDGDVLWTCQNTACINPDHLYLGSYNDERRASSAQRAAERLAAGEKSCSRCKITKPLSEFNKNLYRTDGLQLCCRKCDNAHRRGWYRKPGNADASKRYARGKKRNLKKWFEDLKSTLSCERCGESHPAALDFHHHDPQQKEFSISQSVGVIAKRRIEAEIAKCEVLCANCHRKHHYEERKARIAQGKSARLSNEMPRVQVSLRAPSIGV